MTMPYDSTSGRQNDAGCRRTGGRCSAIISTILLAILSAAVGVMLGAVFAGLLLEVAMPALITFTAIIFILLALKIVYDLCGRRRCNRN